MRLGLIIPSSNTTMEYEFWKISSGWAAVHAARMRLQKITLRDLEEMEEQMLDAAVRVADAHVDIMGYGCTSGSLFKGKGHAQEIEKKIQEKTGVPAVAAARAVVEALDKLHINRVSVATPYTDEINELERRFLQQNKIDVLKIKGLDMVKNHEVGSIDPEETYELAKSVYVPEANGLFISCTNFRTVEVINQLEKELGTAVVSSSTATFWAMMRKAGINRRLEKYGRLFLI
ncbi:MAG: maleate cis-trans isomerase [Candidatus Aminicenantes bacterium]